MKLNHALIIDPDDHSKFLYPDEDGNIHFNRGDPVFLSCGTNGNTFKLIPNVAYQTFYCLCEKTFHIVFEHYDFNDLNCQYYTESTIKPNGEVFGINKYQIGIQVDKSQEGFVNLIDLYYENELKVTTYVKSEVSKFIAGGQDTNVPVPYYPKSCCFPKQLTWLEYVDELVQATSFAVQLPSQYPYTLADNYLRPNTDFVFIYTSLTPRQSMVYSAAAIATYTKLNMEPQWKNVNHNWRCIENHVNEMAKVLKKNLVVYTGVYDGLRLADKAGRRLQDMHLYAYKEREIRRKKVPIPLYFFKMVIDFTTNSGVVFVTVNNPYVEPGSEHQICSDAHTSMQGVAMPANWQPTNPVLGYSYMCKVDDFQEKVTIFFEDIEQTKIDKLLFIPAASTNLPTDRTTTPKHELK